MSQIVHITFEKLTGLKGEIEGDFICDLRDSSRIDKRLPIIFKEGHKDLMGNNTLLFTQGDEWFTLTVQDNQFQNYLEHFMYGVNFLIKSWSYGGGVTINSQPPN
jgi:hypothetical protein